MVNVWFVPEFTVTEPDGEMLPPDPADALMVKVEGGQFVVPIVNPLLTLAVPPPGPAFVAMKLGEPMVKVAVSCVELLTTVTMLMLCDMLTLTVVTPLTKPVPVTMTLSVCP